MRKVALAQIEPHSAPVASRRRPRPRVDTLTVVAVAAVIAILLYGIVGTSAFATGDNIRSVLRNASLTGIIAAGMTPMVLSGNFVSLGTQQTAVAAAMIFIGLINGGTSTVVAVIVMTLVVLALGAVQAVIIAAGLNPIITTLAAGAMVYGVASQRTNGQVVTLGSRTLSWGSATPLGIPIEVIVFVVFTVTMTFLTVRTVIGRQTTLTGANRSTSELSGISFWRVTMFALATFSISVAIVGVLYGAKFGQAGPQSMNTLTIDVIAAMLLGGIAISGGYGSPWRSAVGAVFISVITNIMVLHGLDNGQASAIEGGIVVIAVALLTLIQRNRSRA